MKLNVILFGKNEAAVEYLFRWLATTLSSVCSSCEVDSLLIRRICPTNGDLWQGVARLTTSVSSKGSSGRPIRLCIRCARCAGSALGSPPETRACTSTKG